ncbi:RelA/SpoT domain-containing protein [Sulfitobacter dubius]|jgi:ppGpp synthetase/RelA/SpoT-type nucleotidyltranferase|uniref:RelA/SpoT domain-containing protein n=1 Tax=Sulfitobacter dubius TaxID=218673 RepID=UPI0030DA6970|tara:strand:+ start:818 stop:1489 length:672 start_codon:yes stop_codon:yes gene_type:complete
MTNTPEAEFEPILEAFDNKKHSIEIFMDAVVKTVGKHPDLTNGDRRIVHSCKSRLKDREHLREKLRRKVAEGRTISPENLFDEVTDLAGVRILHLFQDDFRFIDSVIRAQIENGDWVFAEKPKAYTWDPEAAKYFAEFDLDVAEKPSSYTSVHYLVRPRKDSPQCCEIQVRTLFEEIWGEVDHQMNYPKATESLACKEQIMVLSKIVGAGSRLLDSLKRVHDS